MRQMNQPLAVAIFLLILIALMPTQVGAETGCGKVNVALESLNSWLGDNEAATGWRSYLKSDQLAEQLTKGNRADRNVLEEILGLYTSDTKGLKLTRFVAVREALGAWLDELPAIGFDQLPQVARDAKAEFVPCTEESVAEAAEELKAAMKELDHFLAQGSTANAEAWKKYLRRSEVQEQLQSEDGPDLKLLQSIRSNYYQSAPGLERPEFIAVRQAMKRYGDLSLFRANEKAQEYYEQHLDELATRLQSYSNQSDCGRRDRHRQDAGLAGTVWPGRGTG